MTEIELDDATQAERRRVLKEGLEQADDEFLRYLLQVLANTWKQLTDILEKLDEGQTKPARESAYILTETAWWVIERVVEEHQKRGIIPQETIN